ncbi:MAG: xylulokinase [Lachnospiraceae bacterium]|nr:xylulokinase [Lachnospiraceae bacterium]
MYYLGIDLGTSATKFLLVDEKGNIIKELTKEYDLIFPQPGWSEQLPGDWWKACTEGIPELVRDIDASQIAGIGCGGQMHGLVALDAQDNVIRPAILWNDGRTFEEVDYLNNVIGKDKLSEYTANIAFAGFTAPKILWMKKNEPGNYAKIAKIMLPKDYINFMLTGVHCCDYSDASGMLLLDVKNKKWSREMMDICGLNDSQMPQLFESYEVVGTVKPEIAEMLGLPQAKVVAGAGDNAAAAVGTGTVGAGGSNISVGTSGTLFISSDKFGVDPNNALHSFAHADGGYHLMGCMLSAASCNHWFCKQILQAEKFTDQDQIKEENLGKNHVYFLPYLMGERSPINDTDARGTFTGITMDTTRYDMLQAVYEGVAFAMRDSLEVAKSLGIKIERSNICGGGAKSALWRKIDANVLGIPLDMVKTEQGPGYGAAILAMVGTGLYPSVQAACDDLVEIVSTTEPDPELTALYDEAYKKYREIYPALKPVFKKIK